MITEIASFFFNIGVVIFALAFCNLFYFRFVRIGIINLLIANVFFAIGMAYPKKVLEILQQRNEQDLINYMTSSFSRALLIGISIYIVSFLIQALIFFLIARRSKSKAKPAANADKAKQGDKKLSRKERKLKKLEEERLEAQRQQERLENGTTLDPSRFKLEDEVDLDVSMYKQDNSVERMFAGVSKNDLDLKSK